MVTASARAVAHHTISDPRHPSFGHFSTTNEPTRMAVPCPPPRTSHGTLKILFLLPAPTDAEEQVQTIDVCQTWAPFLDTPKLWVSSSRTARIQHLGRNRNRPRKFKETNSHAHPPREPFLLSPSRGSCPGLENLRQRSRKRTSPAPAW